MNKTISHVGILLALFFVLGSAYLYSDLLQQINHSKSTTQQISKSLSKAQPRTVIVKSNEVKKPSVKEGNSQVLVGVSKDTDATTYLEVKD